MDEPSLKCDTDDSPYDLYCHLKYTLCEIPYAQDLLDTI